MQKGKDRSLTAVHKKVLLTGGGTAGHVTPNIALLPTLKERGWEIVYIGSHDGIEKELIRQQNIPYYGIASGKLRRYFDWKNFTDPFRVMAGFCQARKILKREKPDVVFSKGGFVSVPVVRAAATLKIPVIIHESDMTPGLANRLAFGAAAKVCCNFPETVKLLPEGKAVLTGSPIRQELLAGDPEKGREFCGFVTEEARQKKTLLIIGGSLGSVAVNRAVRAVLDQLLADFNVIHLCGKGNKEESLSGTSGYVQYEYIQEELSDLFALCDVVISRAGANAICELLALRKPAVLIPLSAAASRGDQILNAKSFEKQGFARMLEEENLTDDTLLEAVHEVYENRAQYVAAMEKSSMHDAIGTIVGLIEGSGKEQV